MEEQKVIIWCKCGKLGRKILTLVEILEETL